MATEVIMRRAGGGLSPVTSCDSEALDALAFGVDYRATLTRVKGRSVQHHRLLFALIAIARENYEGELSTDAMLGVLKLKTGHAKVLALPSGEVVLVPSSISFANMDQDAFNVWFPRAVDVIAREFLNGADPLALRHETELRAGVALPMERAA